MTSACRLLISPLAVADLDDIAGYIGRDNPVRAASFIAELEATCRGVALEPEFYPGRADLAPNVRMAVHRRYLVFYRHFPDEQLVRIERVLHGARDTARLLDPS